MKMTMDYVADLKSHYGVTSTYGLAKAMGLGDQTVRGWTKGHTFSDKHAVMVADTLGLNPGEVLAAVAAERTKCPEARGIWAALADSIHAGHCSVSIMLNSAVRLRRWIIAVFTLLATVTPCHAAELSSPSGLTDLGRLEVAYQVAAAADWMQTITIARNPDTWHETNPILGQHPSAAQVNAYFVACGLLHVAITKALPADYAAVWQFVTISVEAGFVTHNRSLGIGFSLPL